MPIPGEGVVLVVTVGVVVSSLAVVVVLLLVEKSVLVLVVISNVGYLIEDILIYIVYKSKCKVSILIIKPV